MLEALDFGFPLEGRAAGNGLGVGLTATGRAGPAFCVPELPARGPGEASPFGPGDGAVPFVVCVTEAPCVGLGLGTPGLAAGAALARTIAAGEALGAVDAFATAAAVAVGAVVGAGGAGVWGRAVGALVGTGGRGEGFAVGALVGTGEGAAVGGTVTVTATVAADGTDVGTAGNSIFGRGSSTACVG
jgi:hypothetical protein